MPEVDLSSAEREARRWARVVVSLRTTQVRVAWLREALRAMPAVEAAHVLEEACAEAEAADPRAEALVHALVELLSDPAMDEAREALRLAARVAALRTLERLLRRPFVTAVRVPSGSEPARLEDDPLGEVALVGDAPRVGRQRQPDYGRGRPLTLGERKMLARRPPPELLPKVLADPHPDVIKNVLMASRLTEDDVVAMVTRRPNHAEVLQQVAIHPRWCQRPRVRNALVLNPATPTEVAIALVTLLRRDELRDVIAAKALHPAVRAAAQERLARRPPVPEPPDGRGPTQ